MLLSKLGGIPGELGSKIEPMTYKFFAGKKEKIELLNFIFSETELQVFDLNTATKKLCEYKSVANIQSKFDLEHTSIHQPLLVLYSPSFGGRIVLENIPPVNRMGETANYLLNGWGLIRLFFSAPDEYRKDTSYLGHFEEETAANWGTPQNKLGTADEWNWQEIAQVSRKLKSIIQARCSIKSIGMIALSPLLLLI